MTSDFYFAILVGWSILFFFWIFIVLFILIRKPQKSKLSRKLVINSFLAFILFYLLIFIFN